MPAFKRDGDADIRLSICGLKLGDFGRLVLALELFKQMSHYLLFLSIICRLNEE